MRLSILRALNDISLLNKRIEKVLSIDEFFVSLTIGSKPIIGFKDIEEIEEDIKSRYQRIFDLIKRRSAIKAAIVASNAITIITINGIDMTVAAAIELKSSIQFNKRLLSKLMTSSSAMNSKVEQHNERVEKQIESLLDTSFSGKNSKVTKDEQDAIAIPFRRDREAKLVDPLNIKRVIDETEEYINVFEREVDSILTESNATTLIEVPEH
ncbi:MAG: hypothetical protein H8D97_00555 [Proteobacteria bacterium]|nr:hypothetical protein [Pseudomonadota bacterium]